MAPLKALDQYNRQHAVRSGTLRKCRNINFLSVHIRAYQDQSLMDTEQYTLRGHFDQQQNALDPPLCDDMHENKIKFIEMNFGKASVTSHSYKIRKVLL